MGWFHYNDWIGFGSDWNLLSHSPSHSERASAELQPRPRGTVGHAEFLGARVTSRVHRTRSANSVCSARPRNSTLFPWIRALARPIHEKARIKIILFGTCPKPGHGLSRIFGGTRIRM